MRRRRLACALTALTAFPLAAPAAAAEPPPATERGVYLVPGFYSPRTTFPLVAGRTYLVTVSSTFTYNGGRNWADCGHWDPETTLTDVRWTVGANPYVDGAPSPCSSMPWNPDHNYSWTQVGTGAPLTIWNQDGYDVDNAGYLVVTIVNIAGATP